VRMRARAPARYAESALFSCRLARRIFLDLTPSNLHPVHWQAVGNGLQWKVV